MPTEVQLVLSRLAHPAAGGLKAQHEIPLELGLGPVKFSTTHPSRLQSSEFGQHDCQDFGSGFGPRAGIDGEQTAIHKASQGGMNRVRQSALLPHFLKQARADAAAQDRIEKVGRIPVLVRLGHSFEANTDMRLFQRLGPYVDATADPGWNPTGRRKLCASRAAEGSRDLLEHRTPAKIPCNRDHDLRRSIKAGPIGQDLLSTKSLDCRDFSENRPAERMLSKDVLGMEI